MGFVGGWFDGAKGWDGPKNVYELTQDPDNPHCLTAELTWSKQDSFDVTITPIMPMAIGWSQVGVLTVKTNHLLLIRMIHLKGTRR